MTDREEAGLRGQVNTCRTERDYVYPDHHWVMHTDDMYSMQGYLLRKKHRNPDGSAWSRICRYDERWRLKEKEHVGEDSELFCYHYDGQSRLESVTLRLPAEEERVFESLQYGSDGTTLKTSYPKPLDDRQRQRTVAAGNAVLHFSADTVVIMTILDQRERPTRKVLYDRDDRVIRRIAFRYDP